MKKRFIKIAPWVIAILIMAAVLQTFSIRKVWLAIQQLLWSQVIILLLLNGLILVLLTARWWIILRGHDQKIPFFSLLGYRLATFGVSYFTPGPHIGGEPLQVYFLEKEQNTPRTKALAALSMDKLLELLINFAFLMVGITLIFSRRTLGDAVGVEAVWLAAVPVLLPIIYLSAIAAGRTPLSRLASYILKFSFLDRLGDWRLRLEDGVGAINESEKEITRFCRRAPGALIQALLVSAVGWLLIILEFWLLVSYLGIDLTLLQLITALTAARIAILLLLPGAIGVLEVSQAAAFGLMDLNPAIGVSAGLLIRLRDVMVGVVGIWWGSRKMTRIKNFKKVNGGNIL